MAEKHVLTDEKELCDRAVKRRAAQKERTDAYDEYLDAIFSTHKGQPNRVIGGYADGRPALRLATSVQENWDQREPVNLLPSIVDSFVSLRGILPTVRVLPESGEETATDQAEKRSRALREQYDHSKLKKEFKRAAFHLVAEGDAVFTLDAFTKTDQKDDPRRPIGVYISVVDPKNCFPQFRFGVPGDLLDDIFLIRNLEPEAVEATYGLTVDDRTDVITYYSRYEKQVIVNSTTPVRVHGVVHDLGFCPAVWVCNKATDGRSAQSDIRSSINLHAQLALVYNIYLDSLMWSTWPIIHITNGASVSQSEVGPGAVIETTDPGKVELLSPAGQPMNALQMIGQLTDALNQSVGISPIQTQGPPDRANISGRALDRGQGPMEQRLTFQNDIFGDALELVNEYTLLMLSEVPGLKDQQMPLYGQEGVWYKQAKTFSDTFTGEDIGGWTRNEVRWDAMLGSSKHEQLVQALQLHKESNGLFPISAAMREFGDDDPQLTLQEGIAEAKMLAQAQQQSQPQQPQQGAQPQGGPQSAGAPPPGAGTPGPGGPPGAGTPPPGPDPSQGATLPGGPGGGGTPPDPSQGNSPLPGAAGQPSNGPLPPFPASPTQPGQQGMGNAAPVPDIQGELQPVLDSIKPRLHGTALLSFDDSGPVVYAGDQRDIPMIRQALTEAWHAIFGPESRPKVQLNTSIGAGNVDKE
jgi:hypothetical protein